MSRLHSLLIVLVLALPAVGAPPQRAATLDAARASISAGRLQDHVATLADDVFEGRALGSRGGRAAGQYIIEQLEQIGCPPAGTDGRYVQSCERSGRNILALWPGTDPRLQHEIIVVGAHYDHVGDGRAGQARGIIGPVYNGADDNASGVAALLEMIHALHDAGIDSRRTILFAFWDGEEQGMLGSKHWIEAPTMPLENVRLAINIDMVGRLRDGRVEVFGTRTGQGLRRLVAGDLANPLWLHFPWKLSANSDHWPFIEQQIPTVMFHTGLHDDYHRPSDDADKINLPGLQLVSRYLLETVVEAADAARLPTFRPASRNESRAGRRRRVQRLRTNRPGPTDQPLRLGISWRTDDAEPASVYLTRVQPDSPADRAGLDPGVRIYAVDQEPFADVAEFRTAIDHRLDAAPASFTLTIESRGQVRTVRVEWSSGDTAADQSDAPST